MYDEYFEWLMHIIDGPREYSYVLRYLYNTEFYSPVPRDDNRAEDGVELRYVFEDETGDICPKGGCCSVLEMMIALAERIDNDFLYEYVYGNRTFAWFWEMFDNLKLCKYDDYDYNPEKVRHIVSNLLERNYKKGGKGSLFPCKHADQNWSNVEIWWQLNKYILERYS